MNRRKFFKSVLMLAAFPVLVFKRKPKTIAFDVETSNLNCYHLRDQFRVVTLVKTGPDKWEIYHE